MEPRRGRPQKHALVVNNAQRAELERMARQSRNARSIAFRARIGSSSNALNLDLSEGEFLDGTCWSRFNDVIGSANAPRL
jgi:hypothetical protein